MSQDTRYDLIIAGAGTSGAALAGIVARDSGLSVLLLEAGPDYGSLADGNWPQGLLDARTIPGTHDWGYSGIAHDTHIDPTDFDRARVIGGCSAHNGCVALSGHRLDYDHWAAIGNAGWDWNSIAPAFERARQALNVRIPEQNELTPYQSAFIDAAVEAGIPRVANLNDPDDIAGVAPSPVNIKDGVRWNTAFAYLDPVRGRENLTIIDNALIDRVVIETGRAAGVEAIVDGERQTFSAERTVLAAGAYGSPAILLRSGIGPASDLRKLNITSVHDLPGVGRNLVDHPAIRLRYQGSDQLNQRMSKFRESTWLPDEQSLAKARSSRCTQAFDLHLYSTTSQDPDTGEWHYSLFVSSVTPRSTGSVCLQSKDPDFAPRIDHGYLSDIDGYDRAVLIDGLQLARRIMQPLIDAGTLATEVSPGPEVQTGEQCSQFIDRNVGIYYHPAGSCRMGPTSDPTAVVDSTGKVHRLDGLYVCDASIFPVLMRANTNLPAAMLAEHMARGIATI